jgi:hypothetical protein
MADLGLSPELSALSRSRLLDFCLIADISGLELLVFDAALWPLEPAT